MRRLLENVTVWDGADAVIRDGAILFEGETIAEVLADRSACVEVEVDERIDGAGRWAIPGLINAHTHLYSALARGMPISPFAPASFTEILEQLWWKLDKAMDEDSVRASALIGAMEAARCGITTLVDHHASPNAIPGSLDVVKGEVCDRVGLRGVFCYELSDRDGPERAVQGIEENVRFLRAAGAAGGGRFAAQFGLHASFTVGRETLERVSAEIPDGAGIHIHVAEGPEDEVHCENDHGLCIVERLDRAGLLRPTSILAHCLHISEAEKDLVAERDAIVVHNPRSNMNNAVGLFDLPGFLKRGVATGLGNDGLGANLLAELFTAGILQKHSHGDPLVGGFDALHTLLFTNNPQIAERLLGIGIGRIAPGAPADVAVLDYVPPTPLRAATVLGHLLFGIAVHSLRVADLFVAGRPVLRDGAYVELDEGAAYAHAREQAERLWGRLG